MSNETRERVVIAFADDAGAESPRDPGAGELAAIVGANLKRLRTRQGHSLERLSKLSGVSRAMLGHIEQGRSVPTIALLWKVARTLGVPFAALTSESGGGGTVVLRARNAKILSSSDGDFTSRALFPFDAERKVEFYKLTLRADSVEEAAAHAPGTIENLTVAQGKVEIQIGAETHVLGLDDAIQFEAGVPHSYRNIGTTPAILYLVMTYAESVG